MDTFRLTYAPAPLILEPRPDVLYPRNTWNAARPVTLLNSQIVLDAVNIVVQPTGGGYMAVSYTPIGLDVPFTIRQKPNFAGQTTFVPCVSWIAEDGSLFRYSLANEFLGEVPFALYTSQLIDPATVQIELWARGDNGTITLPTWTLLIGITSAPGSSAQTVGQSYASAQCIVTVTADAGFGAYMTSCPHS